VSGMSVSVIEAVRALSQNQARLLHMLREHRSRQARRIAAFSRERQGSRAVAPTSWAQQRLWFIDRLEGTLAYHVPLAIRLFGALDLEMLQRALDALVQRHEVLRSVFACVDGEPRQEIEANVRFKLLIIDLSEHQQERRDGYIRHHKEAEATDPFDLCIGPLIRGRLLKVSSAEHLMLLTMHHIVSDGWSTGVLLDELSVLYNAHLELRSDPLEPLPIQYADYAQWQRHWFQGKKLQGQLDYWRTCLEGASQELLVPTDHARPAVPSHRGGTVRFSLDARTTFSLRAIARQYDMTLFMVLYAGWTILLSRLSGQEDISVGTPVANRQQPELENLIGFFANMLVLRVAVDSHATTDEFLRRVREVTLSAYEHQDIPFEKLVETLQPQRRLGVNPFFQVAFALQNVPRTELRFAGIRSIMEDPPGEPAMFDLLVSLEERGGEIVGTVTYAMDLFERETLERWMASFELLLKELPGNLRSRVCDLPIIPESERQKVVEAFNATSAPYPAGKAIHQLFEQHVDRAPDAVAVVYEAQTLSYAQLNQRANQLARYLKEKGMGRGEYVPIVMPRCLRMLIAQLAVLKSGSTFVPVDPDQPIERKALLVRDCGALRVLADSGCPAGLDTGGVDWIDCTAGDGAISGFPTDNLELEAGPLAPAYVMYTSGSTGIPKGVIVPHKAIARLIINNGYSQITASDCVAHCSNPAFDASTFEIWGALLNGARTLIVPATIVLEAKILADVLEKYRVTILWLTVGLFVQYTGALARVFPRLKYLLVGGDVVDPQVVRRVLSQYPPENLLNGYGPTECTTFSTTYLVDKIDADAKSIPIGRPISNTQIYILDARMRPLPIGVAGEIYIGGDGLALGYLNRPELTKERFVANPFRSDMDSRLYKTGDLGFWRPDGVVEYLGRNDQQVKLRGFRVEPAEIEAQLTRHPQVAEAVVIVREDVPGDKRLVAYLTFSQLAGSGPAPGAESLQTYLKSILPDYMVPSAFVALDHLPLTSNGKVNRRALPIPHLDAYVSRAYAMPEGDVEIAMAQIWQQFLHVDRVGRLDDFFGLGGHSLLALKVIAAINRACGCTLGVADLYRNPTLRELSTCIRGEASCDSPLDLSQEAILDEDIQGRGGELSEVPQTLLLTGSTGFVGRFLLVQLLLETDAIVYCLVRAQTDEDAMNRLKQTLMRWDLWREEFQQRIRAIPADLNRPCLGLDGAIFQQLCSEVDAIYHCATSMNHLETYAMAKPTNVAAVKEMLRLATLGRPKLFNYISTLSVFSQLGSRSARTINEATPIDDEKHSVFAGYSASKWVGEKLVTIGVARGISCNIFRLGLVWADTEQGRYDELQREYRLVKSCLLSGRGIEKYRYELPPTPVDYVARSVVFLATTNPHGNGIFHITSSSQMDAGIFECCNSVAGVSLELMPFYEWIREIERLQQCKSLPVTPLIEFAFSMDRESFNEQQRAAEMARIHIDSSRTHRELESAGIVAPALNCDLLKAHVESMLLRDSEVQRAVRQ
jgi:myxalamid-type nonribosomal peptide synthetase MxaA